MFWGGRKDLKILKYGTDLPSGFLHYYYFFLMEKNYSVPNFVETFCNNICFAKIIEFLSCFRSFGFLWSTFLEYFPPDCLNISATFASPSSRHFSITHHRLNIIVDYAIIFVEILSSHNTITWMARSIFLVRNLEKISTSPLPKP
jgi:hypothetical protein